MTWLLNSNMPTDRLHDLRLAVRLSVVTIVWNVLAGGIAVVAAMAVGSLSLAGFGLSAALDSIASMSLVWRFRAEAKDPSRGHRLEAITVQVVGSVLIVVAFFVDFEAVRSLLSHSGPHATNVAIIVTALSTLVLPPLAFAKVRVADRLGSRALRSDGMLTAIGATLAALALLGLGLDASFGWWWSDAIAALLITGLLLREGILAFREAD